MILFVLNFDTNGLTPETQKYCEKYLQILVHAKNNDDPSTSKKLQARSGCFQDRSIFLQEIECALPYKNDQLKVESKYKLKTKIYKTTHEESR